ncbi:uncharacterized protein LOC114530744 isoform X2 [Dendronephthya gigantea]|uniref:uncharacterized protein LOC114530744 isoform X2 n=1 Tax=Dendronephthya gigantea TaxID=151771 RepID=UPI00106C17CA|nr:uncharacterized protein LOC114530744 isoform X2 [Dendronephthya gigantea]
MEQKLKVQKRKTDDANFEMRINERGTRFTEKIQVGENENTVFFDVPKHNNVNRSEVLNDFNLGLTITRVPDVGICHIKPLEKGLSNPGKLKDDMNYIKKMNGWGERNSSVLVSSTEWTIDKQLVKKYLNPTVATFCGDLPVYSLKEITKDGNDQSQRKRTASEFQFCPEVMKQKNKPRPCNPDKWILNCKFVISGTCVWWAKCAFPIVNVNFNLKNCNFNHNWSSVMCCVPLCPPTK